MNHVVSQRKIGQRIREIRIASGLRAVEVAAKLGVSRQHVYHIENGKKGLTVERLKQLSRALGVDVVDILNGRKTA